MWRTGLQERGLVLWTSTGLREQKEKIGTRAKHWAQLRLSALESTEQPGLWKSFSKVFKEMRIQMNSVFGPLSMREVTSLTLPFRIPCCFTIEKPYLIPHNNTWGTTIEVFFLLLCFLLSDDNKGKTKAWWKSGMCWGCLKYHSYKTALRAGQAGMSISLISTSLV